MTTLTKLIAAGAALLVGGALPAAAADLYEPPVVEYQPPQVIVQDNAFGGWYIRGDVGWRWSKMRGVNYMTYDPTCGDPCGDIDLGLGSKSFDFAKLRGGMAIGGGVGYQINRNLRADVTADYWANVRFRGQTTDTVNDIVSTDTSSFRALLLLANAYAEFGTFNRITPYIGAGIGGAHVRWSDLNNRYPGVDDWHKGAKGWRFAWALMAGASYCITNNLHADVGYRFSRIEGGRMFEHGGGGFGAGPGFHRAINTHEVRGGLRYQFGANDRCGVQQVVFNDPEPYTPPPVYK